MQIINANLIKKTVTAEFSLLCKRTDYISQDTGREEGASPEPRQSIPLFRSASRTPAWRARAAGRSIEEAEEGRERRTRRDSPESTRPPPWSPRIVEFAFGELFYRTSPHRARFSARCCFAFYTGVEIWSLDSPMHHHSGPPLTGRTASSSSFRSGALQATFLVDSSQLS